ncbi:MAG: hypothetical protein ACRDRM_07250, partial [Pseudonocardiaceae bacterium]
GEGFDGWATVIAAATSLVVFVAVALTRGPRLVALQGQPTPSDAASNGSRLPLEPAEPGTVADPA